MSREAERTVLELSSSETTPGASALDVEVQGSHSGEKLVADAATASLVSGRAC